MSDRAYYVTTPIYYINGVPHIGHAYTSIAADVVARYARTRGDAFFLTGTDEHGQKVANAAAEGGVSPQAWTDRMVVSWQELCRRYEVSYDDFLRTTEPRHERVCTLVFDRGSSVVNMSPFLHFGSYYQADKGGVVMFSNSGALYWPVRFREGHYPPPGKRPRLRWEWMPEAVSIQELYPYYDYVLTRGMGFNPPPGTFHVKWRGARWTVFERDGRQ